MKIIFNWKIIKLLQALTFITNFSNVLLLQTDKNINNSINAKI